MKKLNLLKSVLGFSALATVIVPVTTSCVGSQETKHVYLSSVDETYKFANDDKTATYILTLDSDQYSKDDFAVVVDGENRGNFLVNHLVAGRLLVVEVQYVSSNLDKAVVNFNLKVSTHEWSQVISGFSMRMTVDFLTAEWTTINKYCELLESGKNTEKEFLEHFRVGNKIVYTADDLIGVEKHFMCNNINCVAKVIGIQHDEIAEGIYQNSKAAITFESFTLLSNGIAPATGRNYQCNWSDGENFDYPNSTLRKNLCGNGDHWSVEWGGKDKTEERTVLQMMTESEPTLAASIKTVNKKVATNPSKTEGKDNWVLTDYQDKIFSLTATEMAQNNDLVLPGEGSAYQYWIANESQTDADAKKLGRTKVNGAGTNRAYWCVSPVIDKTDRVLFMTTYHEFSYDGDITKYQNPVSFAFCL